jgi:hypothetical protein
VLNFLQFLVQCCDNWPSNQTTGLDQLIHRCQSACSKAVHRCCLLSMQEAAPSQLGVLMPLVHRDHGNIYQPTLRQDEAIVSAILLLSTGCQQQWQPCSEVEGQQLGAWLVRLT